MSNLAGHDLPPDEPASEEEAAPDGPAVQILTSREVPLGGPRAMPVRRTLPQRARSLVGAWCFADHYGPDDVSATGGMVVPPHPHTGLATVSWLFTGEIEHRDSAGHHAMVRPGEVNLMTAGRGIAHSEYSTPATTTLHGAQLWLALPESARFTEPRFEHFEPQPVAVPGGEIRVFLGELEGASSPVRVHTPLVGAEIYVEAGETVSVDVNTRFEHGVLVDTELVLVEGVPVERADLAYLHPGPSRIALGNPTGERARVLLLGGEPFVEPVVMWWNFIGRDHDEIVEFRRQYQGEVRRQADTGEFDGGRFLSVPDDPREPLPAPALPGSRLKPRSSPRPKGA